MWIGRKTQRTTSNGIRYSGSKLTLHGPCPESPTDEASVGSRSRKYADTQTAIIPATARPLVFAVMRIDSIYCDCFAIASTKNFRHHTTTVDGHKFAAVVMFVNEFMLVETECMQDCRVQIVRMDRTLDR